MAGSKGAAIKLLKRKIDEYEARKIKGTAQD